MRVREVSTAAVLKTRTGPGRGCRRLRYMCVCVCEARARIAILSCPVEGGARGAVVSQLIGTATAATQSGESDVCEGRIDPRTWTAVSVRLTRSLTLPPGRHLPPAHQGTNQRRPCVVVT